MANIFLSIPILEKPEFKMIFSTFQAILSCQNYSVRIFANENDSLISRVRNVHISTFLNEFPECDYFISIDSDIEIVNTFASNNIFTKLIEHDVDFVGALYPLKQWEDKPTCASIPMDPNIDRCNIQMGSGLIKMKWLSSGCWCIKRSALERMVKAYPELEYVGDDNVTGKKIYGLCIPALFEMSDYKGGTYKKYLSEDWALCERWKAIGGEIYADTSIVLNHLGKIPYSLWKYKISKVPIEAPESPEVPETLNETVNNDFKNVDIPEPGFDLKESNEKT